MRKCPECGQELMRNATFCSASCARVSQGVVAGFDGFPPVGQIAPPCGESRMFWVANVREVFAYGLDHMSR